MLQFSMTKDIQPLQDNLSVDEQKKIFGIEKQIKGYTLKIAGKARRYIKRKEIPTMAGLAVTLHVSKRTLEYWQENIAEFRAICDDLRAKNEKVLLEKGMKSEVNPTFLKFLLSAVHEYREKSDITTENKSISLSVNMGDGKSTDPRDIV